MKMMKIRNIKRSLVTVLVLCVVMMALEVIKTSKEASSNLWEYSEYFTEHDDLESQINTASYLNIDKGLLRDNKFTRSKAARIEFPSTTTNAKCGYDYCTETKKDMINIHLVPHSHDDPGYKKTMNEYFYGKRKDIHYGNISKILDSVIHQLTINKDRKFVYAEIVFFRKWWQLQTESTRETVRDLVKNGRFEFINGGWCVNDEATTYYADIIDQMSLGLHFLAETFGECGRPKIAFQGDTFGHSREQAFLSSLLGFDALFIGRLEAEDKKRRIDELEMEMIWSGSDLPGKHPSIFTGITYNVFDPPPTFCFENICSDSTFSKPINDDVDSEGYNIEERVNYFLDYCWKQAHAYLTNNIVVYMGTDFTYEQAELWYSSMDKLIKHINERQGGKSSFNIFYSTPACYLNEVNKANITWPTKNDDFFPYRGENVYWTGFFSSRPALKYMIRQGSSLLQACKQMASILKLKGKEDEGDLSIMKEAMALLQHHDGITGTHSQRVTDDYVRILQNGIEECTKTANSYYQTELRQSKKMDKFRFTISHCHHLNMSQCGVTDYKGAHFVVNIYNPMGQFINKYIRVPVSPQDNEKFYSFRVIDSNNGKMLPSQLMPIASFVASIPGRNSSASHELIFLATQVPPLGSKSYYVEASVSKSASEVSIPVSFWNSSYPSNQITELKISNEKLSLVVCRETGLITSVTIPGKKKIPLNQQFFWYNGNGKNCTSVPVYGASGVYAFNPKKDGAALMKIGTKNFTMYKGDLVEEIHQTVNDYVGQIIRVYKKQDYIEFDWIIGPIPIEDGIGKEIITRYSTDFVNNGEFYTDANGRHSILRIRDRNETNDSHEYDPVASNYYPITSNIYMTDSESGYRLNVLTDRAQGGGSIEDGQLELMIHRRLVNEDFCLFKEPLNEIAYGEGLVVRGTHSLFFQDTKDDKIKEPGSSTLRSLVQQRNMQPQISFISMNHTSDQWMKLQWPKLEFISKPLPENVKLLSFEPRAGHEGEYILRLEHIYDVDEHPVLSSPVEVSLTGLFKNFYIEEIEETTLDGNLRKSDLRRLRWKSANKDIDPNFEYQNHLQSMERIKLVPMEIRTFVIRFSLMNNME